MSERKLSDDKLKALKAQGAFNPKHQKVKDPLFEDNDFFDPRDVVQVKYEMLRQVQKEGQTVKETSATFGFSRVSFYQARAAYKEEGLMGLSPKKHGPKRAHKLSDEVMEFIEKSMSEDRLLRSDKMAEMVKERFGFSIHSRSIERALARREKKRRRRK